MVSNSIIKASIPNPSKDSGKKKRASRSAKLKQCKLDARREQWLSQVKNKTCKDERDEIFGREVNDQSSEVGFKDLEMGRHSGQDNYGSINQDSDSESPANGTADSVSGGNDSGNSYTRTDSSGSSRSCSSSSSISSGGCCSGSITEEEEGEEYDDGCLDDWEAVADALAADDKQKPPQNPSSESTTEKETVVQLDSGCNPADQGTIGFGVDKTNMEKGTVGLREAVSARAWRADDAFRPQCLPTLLKQKSFPMNSEKHCGRGIEGWGHNHALSVPTSCPICYEDLDFTDSSFLPCLCGFRLCLFCHKRILEGDGRCPGCRKPYELDATHKQASVSGGSTVIRLARSTSMFSRT